MGIPLKITKSGSHLFACRAIDALVSDTAFPILSINFLIGGANPEPSRVRKNSSGPFNAKLNRADQ
jgi:hypothetical protein